MPKTRYHGLIKDYDGGTMMECYIHPSIDYTRIPQMLKAQKEFILSRVRKRSLSNKKVYPGLTKPIVIPPELQEHVSRGNEAAAKALLIPGVLEAGWTYRDILEAFAVDKDSDRQKNHLKSELLQIIRKLEEQHFSWPFREPVDTDEVTDYLEVVKDPVDLSTMEKRIRKGGSDSSSHYKSKQMLYDDLLRMANNCKLYNDPDSTYWECAAALEKCLPTMFPDLGS
jgi:histone acetyltransferase